MSESSPIVIAEAHRVRRAESEPLPESGSLLQVIERAALNPQVDIDKMDRLLAMHERIVDRQRAEEERARNAIAEAAYNKAMVDCQAEMHPIATDATNPQTRSRYASYAQLDRHLRPIYTKHGFALSFSNGTCSDQDWLLVICEVFHRDGFKKLYEKKMPADGKGAKGGDVMTKTHAIGSADSYAQRYLVRGIFNIAVGEEDDDGNGAGGHASAGAPESSWPEGYKAFRESMPAVAKKGTRELRKTWEATNEKLRTFATTKDLNWWNEQKKAAETADAAALVKR